MQFFFVYKTLAHPELDGNLVQPFTQEERVKHAKMAKRKLGTSISWLVDPIDNRLKHALGDRPNSEFILDGEGKIVAKRAWSNPKQVRLDLEKLAGRASTLTRPEEIRLNPEKVQAKDPLRGLVTLVQRNRMQAVVIRPQFQPGDKPFFAKLRAEADADLLGDGAGKLYLGFHLDPLYETAWIPGSEPLFFKMDLPKGVKIDKSEAKLPLQGTNPNRDPRETILEVESWPDEEKFHLTVEYSVRIGDGRVEKIRQNYDLELKRDKDGGGARGSGAGLWVPEQFARQLLERDKDGDKKISKAESHGLVLPHFEDFDKNGDGFLDFDELKKVSDWLNYHHKPGKPPSP